MRTSRTGHWNATDREVQGKKIWELTTEFWISDIDNWGLGRDRETELFEGQVQRCIYENM